MTNTNRCSTYEERMEKTAALIEAKKNFVVIGPHDSGKTHVLTNLIDIMDNYIRFSSYKQLEMSTYPANQRYKKELDVKYYIVEETNENPEEGSLAEQLLKDWEFEKIYFDDLWCEERFTYVPETEIEWETDSDDDYPGRRRRKKKDDKKRDRRRQFLRQLKEEVEEQEARKESKDKLEKLAQLNADDMSVMGLAAEMTNQKSTDMSAQSTETTQVDKPKRKRRKKRKN